MADAIVKLKVESQEYDSKIKSATAGMEHLERTVRKMGASFEVAEKEDLEFVRSLGQMETKAYGAKGKLKELTTAFTDLTAQYNRLTDKEKAAPWGKAMAQSMQQLKGRIGELQGSVNQAEGEINGLGNLFENLAGKLGVPTELITKFGAAALGIGAALKVAGDALKQNENIVDEWGRTKQAASSLYEGFLNALNTGDFSGYFQSMSNIVTAARDAYDALDELETFNAFNQINKQRSKTEFQQAIANFREGKGSKEDVVAARDALIAELEAQRGKEEQAYYNEVLDVAREHPGVNGEELYKLLSSGGYTDYEAIKGMMPSKTVTEYKTRMDNMGNIIPYEHTYNTFADDTERLAAMLRMLTDEELGRIQALGAQAYRTATEVEQVRRQAIRYGGTAVPMGGKGSIAEPEEVLPAGSIAEIKARIAELNKSYEMAGDATTRDKIRTQLEALKAELEMANTPMTGLGQVVPLSVELLDTSKEALAEEMEELRKRLGLEPIKLGVQVGTDGKGTEETAKQTEKAWGAAANAIQAIGGALQQIEDPSAKVAGIIMQAVATIALGYAIASTQAAKAGPIAWIAATVAGVANMVAAISAIKEATSAGKFADGGIVGGNSYSGDNLTASVNSGELILNRSQQNVIASQLQGGASKIRVEGFVRGHDILLAGSNYALSTGKMILGQGGYALPIIAG